MIRIGIVGTESSHAMAFAKYFNTADSNGNYPHNDIRVTAVLGDKDSTIDLQNVAGVEYVADINDMIGKIDAIMITSRNGSLHHEQAMPFVEQGIPLFIDKPLTTNVGQAANLIDRVIENQCLVMGGSGCKFAPDVVKLSEVVSNLRQTGELKSASMAFTLVDSPHDGFWFYSPHLVEMATEIFGYSIKGISAVANACGVLATLHYSDIIVTLHFNYDIPDASCVLYTGGGAQYISIDLSGIYAAEADRFANMLINRELPQHLNLLSYHVKVIETILAAIRLDGKYIAMKD